MEALDRQRTMSAHTWQHIHRNLTHNERSAWVTNPESQVVLYWKLDKVENGARMRKRLKRNYTGNDHRESTAEAMRNRSLAPYAALPVLRTGASHAYYSERKHQEEDPLDVEVDETSWNVLGT